MEEKEKEQGAGGLSRREFLKDAGLVAGAAATGALAACTGATPAIQPTAAPPPAPTTAAPAGGAAQPTAAPAAGAVEPAFEPEQSFISGTSTGNFGRDSNAVRVEVKNGKMIRIRPLQYDQEGFGADVLKPWKLEVRGKVLEPPMRVLAGTHTMTYKRRVYSPNRIRYPLKRVDWEPGGDPAKMHAENRGISKYKRISWDEATTLIASELVRIQKKYGYLSVLAQGDGHGEGKVVHGPHGCQTQLLRHMGPDLQSSYTLQIRTPDSWEGWYWGAKHFNAWETIGTSAPGANMTKELADNCQLMIHHTDKETTVGVINSMWVSRVYYWFRDLGIEQVFITPDLNYSGAVHADKWIPVLPCQDGALYLAVMYTWLKEDTYDKKYIDTHSVGFDKFKAYVMGQEAGDKEGPKTPEWAAPKCGVPAWTIRALAHNWYKKKTSQVGFLGAGMRGTYSTEPCRLNAYAEAMQGWGAPGRNRYAFAGGLPGSAYSIGFDTTLTRGEPAPARGLEEHEAALDYFRPNQFIPKTLIHDAILNPPVSWYGTASPWMMASDQSRKFAYPIAKDKGGTEIHMIWTDTPCWTACWNGGNRYIQALRDPKIEFVLTEHPWMENDTLLSDIILPTTTRYEENDISAAKGGEGFQAVFMKKPAVAPIGESKTDYEVSLEVAKKLDAMVAQGTAPKAADGKTWVQKYTWGKSVDDWFKLAWDSRKLTDLTKLTWEQFLTKGLYVVPTDPNWQKTFQDKPGARGFYEDPKANPIQTPTGLLEFESTFLAKNFPDDKERPPVAHWVPEGPTHQENPLGEKGKKYPLLVISNHPRWRGMHAQGDDIDWLREIPTSKVKGIDGYMYEPIWIHPKDAEKRGIKSGDIIGMFNEKGTVLGGAYVTERIIPGAVYQDHGARSDFIVAGPTEFIDRGGNNNLICPEKTIGQKSTGQVCSGFLVEVQKTDINALKAKYPEAFARDYDPASGLRFSGWVVGGEL